MKVKEAKFCNLHECPITSSTQNPTSFSTELITNEETTVSSKTTESEDTLKEYDITTSKSSVDETIKNPVNDDKEVKDETVEEYTTVTDSMKDDNSDKIEFKQENEPNIVVSTSEVPVIDTPQKITKSPTTDAPEPVRIREDPNRVKCHQCGSLFSGM